MPPKEDPVAQLMSSIFWQLSAPQVIKEETAFRNTYSSTILKALKQTCNKRVMEQTFATIKTVVRAQSRQKTSALKHRTKSLDTTKERNLSHFSV